MKIPFHTTDWKEIPVKEHAGTTGKAFWQTLDYGDLRIRQVRYSRDYSASHWCTTGHLLYCLDGEIESELADGRRFTLSAGMSYQVSDGASRHRSTSKNGATLLIIDGKFLNGRDPDKINPWKM